MLAIANVAGALLLLLLARHIAKVTFILGHLLVPVIVVFVFMGAWLASSSIGDWVVLPVFGSVGYLVKRGGVPRPPMVLGLVIGPIMENALFITNSVHDGLEWLARPICLVIAVLIAASIVFAFRRQRRMRAQAKEPVRGRDAVDPTASLLAAGLLLAASTWGLAPTFSWPADVGQTPMLTFIVAVGLSLMGLWHGVRAIRQARADGSDLFPSRPEWGHAGHLLLWWLGLLGVTVAAGQLIALPAFAALYVIVKGRQAWWTGALYAVGAWVLPYGVFEHSVGVLWYPSLLFH